MMNNWVALNLLAEVVEKDGVGELVPGQDAVDVLLVLTDPLAEVSVADLEAQPRVELFLSSVLLTNVTTSERAGKGAN